MVQVEPFQGITLTPLKIIEGNQGNVMHALRQSDFTFNGFGEAYFSTVNYGAIKGWKKHLKMVSNIIVPMGEVKFIFFDDRPNSSSRNKFYQVNLSIKNYFRLTIEPGLWMAFKGLSDQNIIMNIASIEHDPDECLNKSIDYFNPPFEM